MILLLIIILLMIIIIIIVDRASGEQLFRVRVAEAQEEERGKGPRIGMRGWQNTVELVLFEVSNSMKPYPLCL